MSSHSLPLTTKSSSQRALFCGLVLTLLLCNVASALGQDERHPQRGFYPGNSYALSDIETISMSSGNLMMNVPLGSLPAGRGGSSGFQLSLMYNSKLYDSYIDTMYDQQGNPDNQYFVVSSEDGGWRYALPVGYEMQLISRFNEEPRAECDTGTGAYNYQRNAYIWKMQMIYPDGSTHGFRPVGYSDQFADGYFNISANGWIYSVN